MVDWIVSNLGTILITLALLLVVAFAIRAVCRSKKKGCCPSGGSCSCCPMSGTCHKGHK
jgi:hypothetical protein